MPKRTAFTLIEVLIVVVIMAILAATIIPQFTDSTKDAKLSTIRTNLNTLRERIQLYRAEHNGLTPSGTLQELILASDVLGNVGTGTSYPYGPYLQKIPVNSFSNNNAVRVITSDPAGASDPGSGPGVGWMYNATTGNIWIDHPTYYTY